MKKECFRNHQVKPQCMENPQLIAHKSYVFFQLYFGYIVSDAKAKPASIQIRIVNLTGNYE